MEEEADLGEDEEGGERGGVEEERLTSVRMREEGSEEMLVFLVRVREL